MKKVRLEIQIRKILFNTLIPMIVLMTVLLFLVIQYVRKYDMLSENLAVSSEFNLHFKDDIDLEMYYIAIGSKENSYLPEVMNRVEAAKDTLSKLQANTSNKESRKNIKHLESYLNNLARRMEQLTRISSYSQRITFMDNNIRILTSLIMEEMQSFIYNESMNLVHVEASMTKRVYVLMGGMTLFVRHDDPDPFSPLFPAFQRDHQTCDRNPWKCKGSGTGKFWDFEGGVRQRGNGGTG